MNWRRYRSDQSYQTLVVLCDTASGEHELQVRLAQRGIGRRTQKALVILHWIAPSDHSDENGVPFNAETLAPTVSCVRVRAKSLRINAVRYQLPLLRSITEMFMPPASGIGICHDHVWPGRKPRQ